MKYVTGYFCAEDRHSFLVLQQLTRRRGNVPIVFAAVGEGEEDEMAKELTEWFYERIVPYCVHNRPETCVDLAQELLKKTVENQRSSFALLFAVDEECFYAWKGKAKIWLINERFNRRHCKSLTRLTDELCLERVQIQPGVVLFLENGDLGDFREMPGIEYFQNNKQADRYLKELADGQDYEASGVLIIVQEMGRR